METSIQIIRNMTTLSALMWKLSHVANVAKNIYVTNMLTANIRFKFEFILYLSFILNSFVRCIYENMPEHMLIIEMCIHNMQTTNSHLKLFSTANPTLHTANPRYATNTTNLNFESILIFSFQQGLDNPFIVNSHKFSCTV